MTTPVEPPNQSLDHLSREARRCLAAVIGYSEIVEEELMGSNAEAAQAICNIYQAARGLMDIVSALEQRAERESRAASTDHLTGLPNRRALQAAEARLARAPVQALLVIDLDGFKTLNDTYGHKVGDEVLVAVAKRMRRAVRDTDLVVRLGGDEFVCLLYGDDENAADIVVQRMHDVLMGSPVQTSSGPVEIGASIGAAVATELTSIQELMEQADQSMYQVKRRGAA